MLYGLKQISEYVNRFKSVSSFNLKGNSFNKKSSRTKDEIRKLKKFGITIFI